MIQQLMTNPGDATSTPAAGYSVNIEYKGFGAGIHLYRITVTSPGFTPTPAFDREYDHSVGHTDHATAQAQAEHFAKGVAELVEFRTGNVTDERIAQMVEEMPQVMDEAAQNTTHQAEHRAADILWTAKPTNIGAFAQLGRTNTRPIRRAPLNDVLLKRALDAANPAGDIYVGPGVSARFLEAMAARNMGRLICGGPGRRKHEVVKLHLHAKDAVA